MDLLGTHVPNVQVGSRTGRPTVDEIAASDLNTEPMNETVMKQRSAPLSRNQTEAPVNIPVEVYTGWEAGEITQVTTQSDKRNSREGGW